MKKVLNIISKVLVWILVIFTVGMMIFTVFTVTTVDKNERDVFGIKFFIVQSGSMSKSEKNKDMDIHFDEGDIIIVRELSSEEKAELKPGDVISFVSHNDESYWETITHMILEVNYNKDGKIVSFTTFGTNTGAEDKAKVEPGDILGKYVGKLPKAGYFFAFVKTVPGYIVCILVPFLLLILYNGVDVIRLFRRYKQEQMSEMQAEKDQIAADRAETQRMMEELLALKAQLEEKSKESTSEVAPAIPAEEVVEKAEEPAEAEIEPTEETNPDLDETNEHPAAENNEELVEDHNEEPQETLEEQGEENSEEEPPIEPASEETPVEDSAEEPCEVEDAAPTEENLDEN